MKEKRKRKAYRLPESLAEKIEELASRDNNKEITILIQALDVGIPLVEEMIEAKEKVRDRWAVKKAGE